MPDKTVKDVKKQPVALLQCDKDAMQKLKLDERHEDPAAHLVRLKKAGVPRRVLSAR